MNIVEKIKALFSSETPSEVFTQENALHGVTVDNGIRFHYRITEGEFAGCYSPIPVTMAQGNYFRMVGEEARRLESEGKKVINYSPGG